MNTTRIRMIGIAPIAAALLTACGGGSGSVGSMGAGDAPIKLTGPLSLGAVSSDAASSGSANVSDTLANFPAAISQDFATRFPALAADDRSRTINYAGGAIVSETWGIEGESADETMEVEATYSAEGSFLSSQSSAEIAAVPAAIGTALGQLFPNATIDEAEEITDQNGVVSYEVEMDDASGEISVLLDASGNVIEQEREIDRASVPASVPTSIDQEFITGGEIKFEEVTRSDGMIVYEVEMEGEREEVSVVYSASGEVLSMEYESE